MILNFIKYIFIYLVLVNSCEIRLLKLWKISRLCRDAFSGTIIIDEKIKEKIKFSLEMEIKEDDVNKFSKFLKEQPSYNESLYRGIYNNDELYETLIYQKAIKITKYYSFSKNKEDALSKGQQILLNIKTDRNYDISSYYNNEVILDKNIILQMISQKLTNNVLILELIEIKN